jgi:cytochrome c oxidase cbb3-type subunit 3/ubiquinol-cytochrome c reductase cytochrome c subunit
VRPDEVTNYAKLYGANCAACHGAQGNNGPSIALSNPVYQALVPDDQLHTILANGRGNMPAFAQSAGGMLTDKQISVLIYGMRQHWAKPGYLDGANAPAYAAHLPASPDHGGQVFATACASCHGTAERPGPGGNLTDPTYLQLVSDQYLRTTTVAGRPDIGQPDWRADGAGHPLAGYPLSDQDVTDVVAWISSHRPAPPTGTMSRLQGQVNQDPEGGLHPAGQAPSKAAKPEPGGVPTSSLQKRRS